MWTLVLLGMSSALRIFQMIVKKLRHLNKQDIAKREMKLFEVLDYNV